MVLKKPFKLETERLFLRSLTAEDLQDLQYVFCDKQTMSYYPEVYSIEMVRELIEKQNGLYRNHGFGLWAVILKSSDRLIGDCGITLQDIDGETLPEIGYHLNKEFWHKGYATEAAEKCLKHGFKQLKLAALYIHTYVKNIPSQKVAERLHMNKVKVYPKFLQGYNLIWDHVVYKKENPFK